MKTVNSLSGGKTSSYMAVHYPADIDIFACVCIDDPKCSPKDKSIEKYTLDKLQGNFIATAEHELTLKVMMDLEQIIGREIIWVRGKSFDDIVDTNSALPSWNRRFCTIDMKIIPIAEYIYFRYGKFKENIGFRYDEVERAYNFKVSPPLQKDKAVLEKYPVSCNLYGQQRQNRKDIEFAIKKYPMIDNPTWHSDIIKYWAKEYPEVKFPLDSNCRGCHHKPEWLIKKNWLETPEVLEWFSRQESKKIGKKIGKKMFYTWKDSLIPYKDIFKTDFQPEFDFMSDFTMCNSGGCTD